MRPTLFRRTLALVGSTMLLASITAATVAAPASAADAMCRGAEATITGTPGDDVIRGTNGRDVIAGLAGDDIILGRGGNDLICGGLGDDRIAGMRGLDRVYGNGGGDRLFGGVGPDLLFGGVGDDLLVGRGGNDRLDGGPGTDRCFQNAGFGPKVNCELPVAKVEAPKAPEADLAVDVDGSSLYNIGLDPLEYTVTVTNHGPADTTFELSPMLTVDPLPCTNVTSEPSGAQALLAAGDSKQFDYEYACGTTGTHRLTVTVIPTGGVIDPISENDSDFHDTGGS